MLEQDIKEVLVTREEIQEAVNRLGEQLTKEYKDKRGSSCWNTTWGFNFYGRYCSSNGCLFRD